MKGEKRQSIQRILAVVLSLLFWPLFYLSFLSFYFGRCIVCLLFWPTKDKATITPQTTGVKVCAPER
jgi:hypothetical protein